jgi:hypothetical protein
MAGLCGCDRTAHTTEEPQKQVAALQREVSALSLNVANAEMLRDEIQDLRGTVQDLEFQLMSERMITLKPNSDGYSAIRTTLGNLTVSITSISAKANGTSVVLNFGNPLACDLREVEMWVRYGETDRQGNPVQGAGKSKHVKLDRTLRGGRFTTIRLGLDDIKPDKLGYISIGNMHHGGIALTQ